MMEQEQTYWLDKGGGYSTAIQKVLREQAESCIQYINGCLLDASAAEDKHSNSSPGVFPSSDSAIYWAISMVFFSFKLSP
jgi:hypothetical protein